MATEYEIAPIVEAVFEFAPTSVPKWYEATPRHLVAAAGEAFPRKDEVVMAGVTVQIGAQGGTATAQEPVRRTRVWRDDKSRMFQFGPDLCAFNAFRPYTAYVDYRAEMEPLVQEYASRARPTGVLFLGQRYLNHIMLPDKAALPSDYLSYYPRGVAGHQPFAMQLQVCELVQGTVVLALVFQGLDRDTRPIYLIDVYARTRTNPDIPFEWEPMRVWQDAAHRAIIDAFEGAITDKCRSTFTRTEA